MKSVISFTTVLLALSGAFSAEMKACSGSNLGGACSVKTSYGKYTGSWNSYNWRSSTNMCVMVCRNCDSLGWRCQSYSNNSISFNKFIIFNWANGSGPDSTSCC